MWRQALVRSRRLTAPRGRRSFWQAWATLSNGSCRSGSVGMRWRSMTASSRAPPPHKAHAIFHRNSCMPRVVLARRAWHSCAPTQSPDGTFVSSFYQMDQTDIFSYLKRKGLYYKDMGADKVAVKICPFCPPTKSKVDNMHKLYIWKATGSFFCHRCSNKGSWFDLKRRLGDVNAPLSVDSASGGGAEASAGPSRGAPGSRLKPAVADQEAVHKYFTDLFPPSPAPGSGSGERPVLSDKAARVMRMLTGHAGGERGLNEHVLRKYRVGMATAMFQADDGMWREHVCVSFPWTRVEPVKGQSALANGQTPLMKLIVDRVKLRSIQTKANQRLSPSGGRWGFFGWHTVPEDAQHVVITEGEYDAVAVHQMTGFPAISLPNGANSLPVELLPQLERFQHITLWMDEDTAGQEGAQKFARKLGLTRCVIVHPQSFSPHLLARCFSDDRSYLNRSSGVHEPGHVMRQRFRQMKPKDANEALKIAYDLARAAAANQTQVVSDAGAAEPASAAPAATNFAHLSVDVDKEVMQMALAEVMQWVQEASPIAHQQIATFSDLRNTVRREITDPSALRGLPCRSLPGVTRLLKGQRRGELTIITGSTGVGKTTLLSQLSLDYCQQGMSTLWGSFEIKNERLARSMLLQFAGQNKVKLQAAHAASSGVNDQASVADMDVFDLWADRFQQLPLYFLRFFGSTDVEQVLDAMEYAVYVHDVEHIVLDNLQFMLAGQQSSNHQWSTFDKFDVQDRAVQSLRQFATNKNVHISLVVHPRKENDPNALNLSSVFGGAKVTQEADNVMILAHAPPLHHRSMQNSSGQALYSAAASTGLQGGLKRLQVLKNRFDGETGDVWYQFDRDTCLAVEVPLHTNIDGQQGQSNQRPGQASSSSQQHQQRQRSPQPEEQASSSHGSSSAASPPPPSPNVSGGGVTRAGAMYEHSGNEPGLAFATAERMGWTSGGGGRPLQHNQQLKAPEMSHFSHSPSAPLLRPELGHRAVAGTSPAAAPTAHTTPRATAAAPAVASVHEWTAVDLSESGFDTRPSTASSRAPPVYSRSREVSSNHSASQYNHAALTNAAGLGDSATGEEDEPREPLLLAWDLFQADRRP